MPIFVVVEFSSPPHLQMLLAKKKERRGISIIDRTGEKIVSARKVLVLEDSSCRYKHGRRKRKCNAVPLIH